MTTSELATILLIALLMVAFFSPVAALRLAGGLEAIARELRHHGGAMAGAYASYRGIRRAFRRRDARVETAAVRGAA